jgi:hypothetical protein
MDPKSSSDAISEGMRDAAETTLSKAREAVDRYMKEATRVFTAVDSTAHATQASARDVAHKAVGYAEANVAAAFEFARDLLRVRDAQELVKLQQSFMHKQAEALGEQMKEIGSTVADAVSKAQPKT